MVKLLNDKTSQALDVVLGGYFDLNRTFDRAVSVMTNDWAMPKAGDIIHHKLAHLFPLMADLVSEFKDNCNIASVYPATHMDDRTYDNLQSMMTTLLDECETQYKMIALAYKVAVEEGDFNAQSMLVDLMNKHTIVIGQVHTLYDKSSQMPTDYDTFDAHIDRWGIDGLDFG